MVAETIRRSRAAAEEDGEVLGCEAGWMRIPSRSGVCPEGERATIEVPGPHIRVNQIAAIGMRGTVRFMTKGVARCGGVLVFLTRLIGGEPEDRAVADR